jgi:hypothetical protein
MVPSVTAESAAVVAVHGHNPNHRRSLPGREVIDHPRPPDNARDRRKDPERALTSREVPFAPAGGPSRLQPVSADPGARFRAHRNREARAGSMGEKVTLGPQPAVSATARR